MCVCVCEHQRESSSWQMASVHRSSMELSADPQMEGQEEAPPAPLACVSQMKSSSYSSVQQQGYSATLLLRRSDKKLEQVSQTSSRPSKNLFVALKTDDL